jgi:phage portal protein BeeE
MRKGWSPIKTVLREIFTDEQAARFSAALLQNLGVPGLMLSPTKESKRALTPDEARAMKLDVEVKTTGDRRGEALVFTSPTELKTFGFSPEDLNLSDIRNVPEERVSAIMRVPAMVAQFGTGLEGVKVGATAEQLWAQLWQINILPTMRTFAQELQGQLLPDFVNDAAFFSQEVAYDIRDVAALQDMLLKKQDRWIAGVGGGIIMRSEARAALGLPWTESDKVYIGQGLNEPAPQPGDNPAPAPAPDAALTALTDQVGKMRNELALAQAKMPDARPDPNVLRLIEAMDRASASRDATILRGMIELAAGMSKAA